MASSEHLSSFDYTPLDRTPSHKEITYFRRLHFNKVHVVTKVVLWVGAISFILLTVFFSLVGSDWSFGWRTVIPGLVVTSLFLVIYIFCVEVSRRRAIRFTKIYLFAQMNRLTVTFNHRNQRYLTGLIFEGCNDESLMQIHLSLPGNVTAGEFIRITGSGRSRRQTTWGFARFPLPRHLPHMVLDATSNNTVLGRSNLDVNAGYGKSQRLSLEGDFDKHFALYAPVEYKRDALYIFTPDVMQALIKSSQQFDIEIIDNQLFFYHKNGMALEKSTTYNELAALHRLVERKVKKQAKNYADDRAGKSTADMVAAPGRRLTVRTDWIAIIICSGFFLYGLFSLFEPVLVWIVRWVQTFLQF